MLRTKAPTITLYKNGQMISFLSLASFCKLKIFKNVHTIAITTILQISKRDMNPFFQKGGFIMSNKKSKLGVISAVAAGTGTAIYLAQKSKK